MVLGRIKNCHLQVVSHGTIACIYHSLSNWNSPIISAQYSDTHCFSFFKCIGKVYLTLAFHVSVMFSALDKLKLYYDRVQHFLYLANQLLPLILQVWQLLWFLDTLKIRARKFS